MRHLRLLFAGAALALLVVGCGSDGEESETLTVDEVRTEVARSNDANAAEAECQASWNVYVDQWNAMPSADRDAWDGFEEWAEERGYPTTYTEHKAENCAT